MPAAWQILLWANAPVALTDHDINLEDLGRIYTCRGSGKGRVTIKTKAGVVDYEMVNNNQEGVKCCCEELERKLMVKTFQNPEA